MARPLLEVKGKPRLTYIVSRHHKVIPKPRACTSEARDLAWGGTVMFTCHSQFPTNTSEIRHAQDPSLRLKNGYARDDRFKKMAGPKHFYVYIMTNRPRSHVLYTGITGNLLRRACEHKNKVLPGFTSRYNLTRLVYYERFAYPDAAIDREKEIKGWRRSKKIRLIKSMNPTWHDLAEAWADLYKPGAGGDTRRIPRSA